MSKIKAIIADVDGVMVGKAEGVNFPLPHTDVIRALKRVSAGGVPVILCSAKFRTAIDGIIMQAKLTNPHITDGGALIINPLGKPEVIEQNVIDKSIVADYLAIDKAHTELYTAKTVYMEKRDSEFARRRSELLQTKAVLVDSLLEVATTADIIKVISFAENREDMPRIEAQVKQLGSKVHYIWSYHPRLEPRFPCVITAVGVSKEHAAQKVASYLGIDFAETLGIGDSPADWNFMHLCRYAATVGDDEVLRRQAASKGPGHYFHASSVDDHGFLQILEHFELDA